MTSEAVRKLQLEAQAELDASGAGHYRVEKIIGKGSYGIVFQAFDTQAEQNVAIKKVTAEIFKDAFLAHRILREICMLAHFRQYPNIMGLVDIVPLKSRDFDTLYIVMEHMDHDLKSVLKSAQPLTEQHVRYFIYQILCGLHYIDKAGVIHRDITPANILVNANCDLKICDFGLARTKCNWTEMTDYVCMRWYRAPELVMEETNYTSKVDIWACGCIMAELLNNRHQPYQPLFRGEDRIKQLGAILKIIGTPSEEDMANVGSEMARRYIRKHHSNLLGVNFADLLRTPDGARLSPDALDLVQRMLTFNPEKRISVHDAMRHPYLKGFFDEEDVQYPIPKFDFDMVYGQLNPNSEDIVEVKSLIFHHVQRICELVSGVPSTFTAPPTAAAIAAAA
eukprot:RCo024395